MSSDQVRFDHARVEAFAGGDAALAADLVALFLNNAARHVADYAATQDAAGRAAALHKLKGAALTVGAGRLAALCLAGEAGQEVPGGLGAALAAELQALESELGV